MALVRCPQRSVPSNPASSAVATIWIHRSDYLAPTSILSNLPSILRIAPHMVVADNRWGSWWLTPVPDHHLPPLAPIPSAHNIMRGFVFFLSSSFAAGTRAAAIT